MAFFGVSVETIEKTCPIENADRIEIAVLKNIGFSSIVQKNKYSSGDKCLYFPIDSLVPEPILEKLGLKGKLAGPLKNRVKTIKMRGYYSQGIIAETSLIPDEMLNRANTKEITEYLGVEKYVPALVGIYQEGDRIQLPYNLSPYDIEGAERNQRIVDLLLNQSCVITEKMEGTNFSVAVGIVNGNEQVFVNTRRHSIIIEAGQNHLWCEMAEKLQIYNKIRKIRTYIQEAFPNYYDTSLLVLYGELCGPAIQGNIYNFTEHDVFFFDLLIGVRWCDAILFYDLAKIFELRTTPVIHENNTLKTFLKGTSIVEASNGKSVFGEKIIREGIVIRPHIEQYDLRFGRVIIKQRSPEYLAKTEN